MLKFKDLSIDKKSYENSLNSFMKLYPNSYMPLLIMYLSREGLIKIEYDVDENDPRMLLSVTRAELADFLDIDKILEKRASQSLDDNDISEFNQTLQQLSKDCDLSIFSSYLKLFSLCANSGKIAMLVDVPNDSDILKVKDIILRHGPIMEGKPVLLCFYQMICDWTTSHHSKEYESDPQIGLEYSRGEWTEAFDRTIDAIHNFSDDRLWMQPKELTQLILTKYRGGSIYNPFAGIASYAVQLHIEFGEPEINYYPNRGVGDNYYAEEIDELTWAIGKLRLLAYDSDSANYNLGDSTKWRSGVAKNVISTPPFGYRIINESGEKELAEHFVIRRGLDMLADNGLLACVVPLSFLYRKDSYDVRKTIIDNKWLESVVYLPEKVFSSTSIRTAILFIRKTQNDKVLFVDGGTSYIKVGRVNRIDHEVIANLMYDGYSELFAFYDSDGFMEERLPEKLYNKLRVHDSIESIKKNDYSLMAGPYFDKIIKPAEGFELLPIMSFVKDYPESSKGKWQGLVISPSMLSEDSFKSLSIEDAKQGEVRQSFREITEDALLVSSRGSLRPTLFKMNNSTKRVAFSNGLLHAVYINRDLILPEYLVGELTKDYVIDQQRRRSVGDVPGSISFADFLSIYIQVPEASWQSMALDQEKEIVDQQSLIYYAKIEKELSALKDKQHEQYVKNLRQRKHRLQQVMNEFSPAFSLLDKCRKKNGGKLSDDDVVASRTGETVEDYFEKLGSIVSKVEDLITNLVEKENWGTPERIDMDSYVDAVPHSHLSDKYEMQIMHEEGVDEDEEESGVSNARMVMVNKDDLGAIFDNIIANASKWGFTEDLRRDYRIRIMVSDTQFKNERAVKICISNNGTPIHESVDRSRLFEWGYGSGSGIGGSQLKEIVEHYGGSIQLNEYPDDPAGFCTEFEIVLPCVSE